MQKTSETRREFIDAPLSYTQELFYYHHSFPVMRAFDDNFGGSGHFLWMAKMGNYKNVKTMIKAEMEKVCERAVSAKRNCSTSLERLHLIFI